MNSFKAAIAVFAVLSASSIYAESTSNNIKEFHVFLPESNTWLASVPIINEDGKDHALEIDPVHCGWFYRRYINEAIPQKVLIHRKDDPEMKQAIGIKSTRVTNSGNPETIPLDMMFELYNQEADFQNALYFVADENMASDLSIPDDGWSTTRPEAKGICNLNMSFIIYDTDASLHPAFSCWSPGGEGCQGASAQTAAQNVSKDTALAAINACIGVTQGIVNSTLDKTTKKPKLSAAGKKCFINEKYFNQLFNYTEGVNEISCFDMPFSRTADIQWSFASDHFTSPGVKIPVKGGFYPVEGTTDAQILAINPEQKPIAAARTKRNAEGPVFYGPALRKIDSTYSIPVLDLFCKGPGWDNGVNCNNLFATADETENVIRQWFNLDNNACIFGWSCNNKEAAPEGWPIFAEGTEKSADSKQGTAASYRWTSTVEAKDGNGGRNQHFCAESHSSFHFKNGLTFTIRGSDDIWVFIDNKLAIDLGGTHLDAPGFVDLDKFMPNATIDSIYDIDIFTCDRRTTSSNLNIKTNILLAEPVTSGIEVVSNINIKDYIENNNKHLQIRYKTTAHSCGSNASIDYISTVPDLTTLNISYVLSTDKTGKDPSKIRISENDFKTNPVQADGGIDVSNLSQPIINKDKMELHFPAGTYYLIAKIGEDSKAIQITLSNTSTIPATHKNATTKPSFQLQAIAPMELSITTDILNKDSAKQYAIMDMKGQVITSGTLSSNETRVKVPMSGSYIVKVGQGYRRINVK